MSTRCHIKILYVETTRLPVGALLKTITSVLWKRFCRTNYFGLIWDILSWQHKGLETRYHRPPHQVPNLNCCTCDFRFLSNKLEKQESNFVLKLMLCQAREMNSYVQQLQLATWQVEAKGLVGHLCNPLLYCTWILELYHIRGQNSHYKKLVWNERIKEGSKNAPKANLTPRWHTNVILENVLKEGINKACKAYFAVWSIWTFDWPGVGGSQKVIPRERLPAILIGSRDKKKRLGED